MLEEMLKVISERYSLTEKDTGEFSKIDLRQAVFNVRCYYAEGLGHVSTMQVSGMMNMDTIVINPFEKDMALFSYDRMKFMGKDTLMLELYDTLINKDQTKIIDSLTPILNAYNDIADIPAKDDWCNSQLIKASVTKSVTEDSSSRFDELEIKYLSAILDLMDQADSCDEETKKEVAGKYSSGLLEHGGASTNNFLKVKGKEFTEKFFKEVFFGC